LKEIEYMSGCRNSGKQPKNNNRKANGDWQFYILIKKVKSVFLPTQTTNKSSKKKLTNGKSS